MSSKAETARDRALRILLTCHDGTRFVRDELNAAQAEHPQTSAEAALAAELALGVMRHRLTAEHIAARFHRGRWASVDLPVRLAIAMGVYQICWLERIPEYAAVNETVRQAARRGRGPGGMANAVLREIAAVRGTIEDRPENFDPRRYLPIDAGRGRTFTENVFPDPAKHPLDYLVAVTSHPPYLVERWHRRFKPALCRQICEAGQRRPPLALRPNILRASSEELLRRLADDGVQPQRLDGTAAILVEDAPAVTDLAAFREGLCQPQDATAQQALQLSPPLPGDVVLDLCTGVGTKATQAAEMMRNEGVVIASDVDAAKLERTMENAARLGLTIVRPVIANEVAEAVRQAGGPLDMILVDAPCTNTGVLARRPEARYRASHRGLQEMAAIQRQILEHAVRLAAPHTRILYSTCSLEREENEDQVDWFLGEFPGWAVKRQQFTLPDGRRDGGFAAAMCHSERSEESQTFGAKGRSAT